MTKTLSVGVIGCGNISAAYFGLSPLFSGFKINKCADINMAAAEARAAEFGIESQSVDEMLADPSIDIIVNLTIPDVHYSVTKQILEAGKHAYSEKPLVLSVEEGETLRALATADNLRVGCAPDTFLGGAHQLARNAIDQGRIGKIVSGTCHIMNHGMEHWHPNPDFFFLPGGGPVLDLGPYYVANLINFLGPVKRVGALTSIPQTERTISSEPRAGERIPVKTATTAFALLQFHSGAVISLDSSWDVWAHRHGNMELYGEKGSIYVPDPNFFGGKVMITDKGNDAVEIEPWDHPFGVPNQEHKEGAMANYRTAGLADMVRAIADNRDHRCSLDRTLHGVDVMTSILKSGETGQFIDMSTTCTMPALLDPDEARGLLVN
jgi:predicted dehydrogenase